MVGDHDPVFEVLTSLRYDSALLTFPPNTTLSGRHGKASGFYMLEYHRDRLLAAVKSSTGFGWNRATELLSSEDENGGSNLLADLLEEQARLVTENAGQPNAYKVRQIRILLMVSSPSSHRRHLQVRVTISRGGDTKITISPTAPVGVHFLFPTSLPPLVSSLSTRGVRLPCLPSESPGPIWTVYLSPIVSTATPFTHHKTTHRKVYDDVRAFLPSPEMDAQKGVNNEILLVNGEGYIMEGSITTPYFWRGEKWVTPPESEGGNVGTTRRWALESALALEGRIIVDGEDGVQHGEKVWLSNGVRGWGLGTIVRTKHAGKARH